MFYSFKAQIAQGQWLARFPYAAYNRAVLTIFTYLLLGYSTICLVLNILYYRRRGSKVRLDKREKISVMVPVRNEEEDIGKCLDSLLDQNYPNLEIIVMDDDSEDRSWQILERYASNHPDSIRVERSRPLPEGWTGKNWVCHQLSELATGSWMVFTDADTVHTPESVSNAYRECIARGSSYVSYLPDLITVTLGEKVLLPIIYFAFYLLLPLTLLKKIRNYYSAVAIGTFIIIRSDTYQKIGGHAELKDEIVDDIFLARMVKKAGENFDMIDGTGIFYTRFYTNVGEVWRGFTKNAFGAYGYSMLPYIATLLFSYIAFLHPIVKLVLHGNISLLNPYFEQALFILAIRLIVMLKTRHSFYSILLHPIMVAFSLLFALNSLRKILLGLPVLWKGRAYRISK